jgi:DNA-binding NarL/FixJ family response regulator
LGQPFDVVIMDLTIPGGMGGKEAIKKLLEIDPKVKAIVSSGYSTDPVMADFRSYGFSGVAVKPYNIEELSEILDKVIKEKDK